MDCGCTRDTACLKSAAEGALLIGQLEDRTQKGQVQSGMHVVAVVAAVAAAVAVVVVGGVGSKGGTEMNDTLVSVQC